MDNDRRDVDDAAAAAFQRNMWIFAPPRPMEESDLDEERETVSQYIHHILTRGPSIPMNISSYMEAYNSVYKMVQYGQGARSYDLLREEMERFLTDTAPTTVRQGIVSGTLLETLNTVWNNYTRAMPMLKGVFAYVNRHYFRPWNEVNPMNPVLPPYDLGPKLFYVHVLQQPDISAALHSRLLEPFAQSRNPINIDWDAVKKTLEMLIKLGTIDTVNVYEAVFERPFLVATSDHYRAKANEYLETRTVAGYIQKVEEALRMEQQNATLCLGEETESRVVEVMATELISKHMRTVIEMENVDIASMLQNNRTADLSRLYGLLKRVPEGLTVLVDDLGEHLYILGRTIIDELADNANPNPVNFVEQLTELRDQYDHFLSDAFENDRTVEQRIQTEFERFLNSVQRTPELLSLLSRRLRNPQS